MSSLKIGGMGDHLGVNVCAVLDSADCCPEIGNRGESPKLRYLCELAKVCKSFSAQVELNHLQNWRLQIS